MIEFYITATICITMLIALIFTQRHIRLNQRQINADQWEKRMHQERMKLLEIDHAKANTETANALAQLPKPLRTSQQIAAERMLKGIQEHDE